MVLSRKLLFRTNKTPSILLPMGARSVGHYSVPEGCIEEHRQKHFVQLFWCIEGGAEFIVAGTSKVLKPQHVFLYFPGDIHVIRPLSSGIRYRWLTLDGPMNVDIAKSLGLAQEPVLARPCPEDLFVKLETDIQDLTPEGERRACVTAFQILVQASGSHQCVPEKEIVSKCMKIISAGYANPFLSIAVLARKQNIHRSHLCRAFKRKMGISPLEYLISIRIQKALSLLKETELSVAEVAAKVGYLDSNYFSKAIRRAAGSSPSEFRRQ